MIVLTRNQVVGVADPRLVFYGVTERGALADPFSLAFQIQDPTGAVIVATTTIPVDVDSLARLGLGRFVVPWTVPNDAPLGEWTLRFFWREKAGAPERSCTMPFEVFTAPARATVYGSPNGLRARIPTVGPRAVTDPALLRGMEAAAVLIERITRRFFEPRFLKLDADGRTAGGILLEIPIIAIERVNIGAAFTAYTLYEHEGSDWIVYNRHLRGMTQPDDRDDPQISFPAMWLRGLHWNRRAFTGAVPSGPQVAQVQGVFGYTSPDGSPTGGTPVEIAMVADYLATTGGYFGPRDTSWAVKSERTREQSIDFGNAGGSTNSHQFVGALTGDPYVDNILAAYCSPPRMGSV